MFVKGGACAMTLFRIGLSKPGENCVLFCAFLYKSCSILNLRRAGRLPVEYDGMTA